MKNKETMWQRIYRHQMFLPLVCLGLVLVMNLIKTPNFFAVSIQNGALYGRVIDIINRSSELVILAVGMTIVVASSGGTDISVGAVAALSGAVAIAALGTGESYAVPYVVGFLLAMLTGFVCGMWNGFLVAKMRIQPMVATLILFTAGRGIAQLINDGQIQYVRVDNFRWLGSMIPGIPVPTAPLVAALVVTITVLVLRNTALGMQIQSVGINRNASRLVGLKSTRIIFLAYAFCGLCAGIAAMIISSRVYSSDPNNAGLNIELDAILAVALGGNSLAGGKFSLAGSVIGAITIQALSTSLLAMKVTPDQLPIYKAVVVILIVALQSPEFKRYMSRLTSRKPLREGVAS